MHLTITIDIQLKPEPRYPGYTLKTITRKGRTFQQWYMIGPRGISLATNRSEGH
jgi:hypothetical protein